MIGTAEKIADWILENDDIAVIVHFRPDGDAYGSALALTEAIRALGKRAFPACDDPVEQKYAFLPGSEAFCTKDTMPFTPHAALGADVSDAGRMGKLGEIFSACSSRAILDHHATNNGFEKICYVDEKAAAAGELALEVIEKLDVSLTPSMALNLYVAISTDSGNFSFQSTSPRTYLSAAKCVEAGVNVEETTRILYRTRSVAKTRLLGSALSRIELFAGGKIAAIRLTKRMFEENGATPADAHAIVNYLNEMEGVRIGILAEEQENATKFSFRAADGADVSQLAAFFGGGGHVAAAGATITGETMDSAFERVIAEAVCRADD